MIDAPVRSDLESNDAFDGPLAVALVEENNRERIVQLCERQTPVLFHR